MQKFRELTEFCERVTLAGRPEQQYVAEGIRELLDFYEEFSGRIGEDGQIKLTDEKPKEPDRGLFPKAFPEKGYIVEFKDGSLWTCANLDPGEKCDCQTNKIYITKEANTNVRNESNDHGCNRPYGSAQQHCRRT